MIRRCTAQDFPAILEIINDGAQAYRGVIPADRWQEPYMPAEKLRHEIADGVVFWGLEIDDILEGVMGLQQVLDVTLIRHAYVRTGRQKSGCGGRLLDRLREQARNPVLIGTWSDAHWAIRFYRKHGFHIIDGVDKDRLLLRYWNVPARQIETSVVLADEAWFASTPTAGSRS